MGGGVLYAIVILQVWILVEISARDFSRVTECSTTNCARAANDLLNYIDQDVNPCDNFYEFACGKFLSNIHLRNESIINVETIMRDNYLSRIKVIIQEPILHHDSPSMKMAKEMYSACTNVESKENSVQLIKDTLNEVGGWAVLDGDEFDEENYDWKAATYRLRQYGFSYEYFLQMHVCDNTDECEQAMIQFGSPLGVIRMENNQLDDILYPHMVDMAVAFGANETTAEDDYADVIALLRDLLSIEDHSWDKDIKQGQFTVLELQNKFPGIPWVEYITQILSPVPSLQMDAQIFIKNIPYIYYLNGVLNKASKRAISNYVAWRMIIEHGTMLTPEISEISQQLYKDLNKEVVFQMPSVNKLCTGMVESTFFVPIHAEYVNRFVSRDAKNDVIDMVETIIDEFKDEVGDLDWMDYETRQLAIDRIINITSYVAYPDEMLDPAKINELYKGYIIRKDNLLASLLSIIYKKTNSKFQQLHKSVGSTEDNTEINKKYTTYGIVYYLASDNTITVPHRVFQPVVYNEDRPKYLNYGGLGTYIAHQLFHAIFEGSPVRRESEYYKWMSPESQEVYQIKMNCVAQQYQQFHVPEINKYVNSSNTKNEDIADIAGIQMAYKAYKKWTHLYGKESKLPRFDYTPKQMFWISSAIRYCSKGSHEAIDKAVTYSYQSLKRFRVLGALKNSKEFAKDFHCPVESAMNPKDKCEFW